MAERRGDSRLSKRLAWLLRHGATEQGFKFIDGCYLNVADVLAHQQFRGYTLDDIQRVVSTNSKKRFELRSADDGALQIRAVQGHSIKEVDGLDLQPITADNCHQFPVAVHGTYMRHWRSISAQGLSRMNRTHIHFAVSSEAGGSDGGAISGLRQSADVLIFVDLPKALADGFKFCVSRNSVILCEGDDTGHLPPAYFKEVWKLKPYRLLIFADGKPQE
ncbi:hypothetical protein BOX15_Mlig019540g1 [Macrostomum lignano]|uniref:Uncharacterized protein n=2 Tax=Macrostomum lignano TaxID=282301 RepID=A0A267E3X5_9PLAT|nr:hypothetical protein BOX15_Mlig019540g1 [Macrostomum lignano]